MIKRKNLKGFVLIFLSFSLYLLTFKGTSHSTDEWLFIDQMGKVFTHGFQHAERFYLSYYALLLPIFSLSKIAPGFGTYQALTIGNMLSTSVTGMAICLLLEELGYSLFVSIASGVTYGIATQAWPYSNYLLREPTGAMWAALATLFAVRFERSGRWKNAFVSLVLITMGILTKRSLSVLFPIYLLYLIIITYKLHAPSRFQGKSSGIKLLILAIVVFAAISLMYIIHRYYYLPVPGNLTSALPNWKTLGAIFFSPGWGLLLFSPVLVLTILGIPRFFKRNKLKSAFLLSLPWLYLIGMSHHPLWWGTWNWGPRQVNPVLPLFILPIAEIYEIAMKKLWLKILSAVLFVASSALAAMQALVSYPFYQAVFKKGMTPNQFMWNWKASPILNHWRFITLSNLEVAWGYRGKIKWGLLLFDLAITAYVIWLMWRVVRRRTIEREKVFIGIGALAIVLATAWTLVSVYRSPAYGGNVGFPEAASVLRREWRKSDALIIYMWGDPPSAYIPKIAMLNYCKGDCCNQISVIKEQFIDGHDSWQKRLFGYLSRSGRAWLIEQKIRENAPERPVEFALAQNMYFVKATWTGPEVRLLLFDKGENAQTISKSDTPVEYLHERLSSFSVSHAPSGLYVKLRFHAKDKAIWHHKISLQVLDSNWKLRAQKDIPLGAFVNPRDQKTDADFTVKLAEYLPRKLPAGKYRLILVVYDPATGTRFVNQSGRDFLELSEISIR